MVCAFVFVDSREVLADEIAVAGAIDGGWIDSDLRIWTLEECLERALMTDADLTVLRVQQAVDLIRIAEERRDRLPGMNISTIIQDTNLAEAFQDTSDDVSQFFQSEVAYTQTVTGSITQPIYAGGEIRAGIDAAKTGSELTFTRQRERRDAVAELVTDAYFRVLEAEATAEVQRDSRIGAEASLETAQRRLDVGVGIPVDVLGEESFLSERDLEIVRAEQARDAAKRALLLLMHSPLETQVFGVADVNLAVPRLPEQDELVAFAQGRRPELTALRQEIESAQYRLTEIRSSRRPSLDFTANFRDTVGSITFQTGDENGNVTQETNPITSPFSWDVGLTLRVPLTPDIALTANQQVNFFKTQRRYRQSSASLSLFEGPTQRVIEEETRQNITRLELQQRDLLQTVANDVAAAYDEVVTARQTLLTNISQWRFRKEEYRIEEKRSELGLTTYSDLLESRSSLVQATVNLRTARYTLYNALYALAQELGLMTVEAMIDALELATESLPSGEETPL